MGGAGGYWATPANGIVYNTRTWSAPQRTFDQVSQNYVYGDWIEIVCPQPIGITSYSFTPSAGQYTSMPTNWSLMGSYGEDLWGMVDQQINESWSSTTPAAYPTNNTSGFTNFRWVFSQVQGSATTNVIIVSISFTYTTLSSTN